MAGRRSSVRYEGPILGSPRSRGGLFSGMPIEGVNVETASVYFNDFQNGRTVGQTGGDLDLGQDWDATDVGTVTVNPSTFIMDNVANGHLRLIADATDGDGNGLHLSVVANNGFALVPTASKVIAVEFRLKHEDWANNHWFVGILEETTSAPVDTNGDMVASLEYVGHHHNGDDDGDGIPVPVAAGADNSEIAGTAIVTPAAGVTVTFRTLGFTITGTDTIAWYVDGVNTATATLASAFTAPMTIAIGAVNNGAVDDFMDVDYVWQSQER